MIQWSFSTWILQQGMTQLAQEKHICHIRLTFFVSRFSKWCIFSTNTVHIKIAWFYWENTAISIREGGPSVQAAARPRNVTPLRSVAWCGFSPWKYIYIYKSLEWGLNHIIKITMLKLQSPFFRVWIRIFVTESAILCMLINWNRLKSYKTSRVNHLQRRFTSPVLGAFLVELCHFIPQLFSFRALLLRQVE